MRSHDNEAWLHASSPTIYARVQFVDEEEIGRKITDVGLKRRELEWGKSCGRLANQVGSNSGLIATHWPERHQAPICPGRLLDDINHSKH
jgi:hypothetical protein